MKACAVCKLIILRRDNLVEHQGKVYCAEHAPSGLKPKPSPQRLPWIERD